MYKIQTLNAISDIIYTQLSADAYTVAKEEPVPDGILVRSAAMHDMELGENLLGIARELALTLFDQLRHIRALALQALRPLNAAEHVAAGQQQAAHDQLGHGVGVRAGGVEHADALLGALVDRDVVHACARAGDAQQIVAEGHVMHRSGADKHAIRHRLFVGDGVLLGGQLGVDDIGNLVQRLNLEHGFLPP